MIGHETNETTVEILAGVYLANQADARPCATSWEAELLRKLGPRRADSALSQKYGMSFE